MDNRVFSAKEITLMALAGCVVIAFLLMVFYLPTKRKISKAQKRFAEQSATLEALQSKKSKRDQSEIEARGAQEKRRSSGADTQEFFAALNPIAEELDVHLGKFTPKGDQGGRPTSDLQAQGRYADLVRFLDKIESNTWADVREFQVSTLTNSKFEARLDLNLENMVERDFNKTAQHQGMNALSGQTIESPLASSRLIEREVDLSSKYKINSVQTRNGRFRFQNKSYTTGDILDEQWIIDSISEARITLHNPVTRETATIYIP